MKPWITGTLAAGMLGVVALAQPATLVATNATWRYFKGIQEASDPVEAWRTVDFDDHAWPEGKATFYYGEHFSGTQLTDMRGHYTTLFLRTMFTVGSPADVGDLELSVVSDDGFMAWINGKLVASLRPPNGPPRFDSVAGGNASEPVRFETYAIADPLAVLRPGENVLAIQAFNRALTSSDLVIDAGLTAVLRPSGPPTVADVQPPPGALPELTEITVTFSEPVTGVDADDFRINGLPADAVTGGPMSYTFTFAQPAFGTVVISWAEEAGIQDLSVPSAPFDPLSAGARWTYELYDARAPAVIALNPPSGQTVRRLTQVEVWFDRPVTGVDAADLEVNGQPAQAVAGAAAGPYVFTFPAQAAGETAFRWRADHGIMDAGPEPTPFPGGQWTVTVDPALTIPDVIINEFMAQNVSGLRDSDRQTEDWIELYNRGTNTVNLAGWSLSDEADLPGKWVFPAVTLRPGAYLVVFASGKDRRAVSATRKLHTNFKLSARGEYLGLFTPESPRVAVSEFTPAFPEQRNDHSYGLDALGRWRYFAQGTPGAANGVSAINGVVEPVHFSLPRGYYTRPLTLSLYCPTPGATIRYTTNGSVPTEENGTVYTGPFPIYRREAVRAAAFKEGLLPSRVSTQTYIMNLPASWLHLPALSLSTDPANLFGRTGIMEVNPRNTTKRGIAWERPVSAELIRPEDNGGFQVDCGLRIQGGNYIRGRYDYHSSSPPAGKYSFRLYFRGDYGAGRLEYPLIADIPIESFDTVTLRAGMNDPTNPFIRDEYARRLLAAVGQVTPRGTFVHLFLNGSYEGYYNPTERVDLDFLQAWNGGGKDYDLIAQGGELREGDSIMWNALKSFVRNNDLSRPDKYQRLEAMLDLVNFADYLIVHTYADTGDWPHNNWRAARERKPGAKWRFYMWDAEWSFGLRTGYTHNTFENQLGDNNGRRSEIGDLFQKLQKSPEWRLLFADRVQKHFFNDGALTREGLLAVYRPLRDAVRTSIQNFNNTIETSWIPNRMRYYTNYLKQAGLWASDDAPVFNQHGGTVPRGFELEMSARHGVIFYTLDGSDPRVRFTGAVADTARRFLPGHPLALDDDVTVKARGLNGHTWSALTEASFQVALFGSPLRISEIMYHPPGGDAFEFLEILNTSAVTVDLSGVSLEGVNYRFPAHTQLAGHGRVLLASDEAPAEFARRYPGVEVAGWFGGSLANGGERVALLDPHGHTIISVDYDDQKGWPKAADGQGASLEIVDPLGDPDDPANWRASAVSGGSPGAPNPAPPAPAVEFSELMADNATAWAVDGSFPDWIELHNPGDAPVSLAGWELRDAGGKNRFAFPEVTLSADGYLMVLCANAPETPADGALYTGFGLDRDGEFLELRDDQGQRVDAVSFGRQVADFSLGRLPGEPGWHLLDPTPEGPNEPATLADAASLAFNEYLPASLPGQDDWVEFYNRDAEHPAALRGLWVQVNDRLAQIAAPVFVPPGGFAVLRADKQPGANHLDLRLPAAGATLRLLDPLGRELEWVRYQRAVDGVSQGRLPDGADSFASFPRSASPGAPNYVVEWDGPVLNEILARSSQPLPGGPDAPVDWIELFNPLNRAFSLAGFSVSVGKAEPGEWTFPEGAVIAPEGYLLLLADGDQPASTTWDGPLNIGHSLSAVGDAVHLFDPNGVEVDTVEFGFQLRDRSIGESASGWALLETPTPGAPNAERALTGAYTALRINEWSANGPGDDWIEVYNPADRPVALGDLRLTDDLTLAGRTRYIIPPLSYIGPADYVLWVADGRPDRGPDHLPFSLDARGESLRLYSSRNLYLDQLDFPPQPPNISQGRFPDGQDAIVEFTATASPGAPNYLPHPAVVVNEVLAHANAPLEDAIELFNRSDAPVDLSGWWLSDRLREPRKYQIPAGTVLPAGGYVVLYEGRFGADETAVIPFHLPDDADGRVVLSEPNEDGGLSGYRAVAEFGAMREGESWGRVPTSAGEDFAPLSARTFGVDAPASVAEFRQGTGAPNAGPRVGPVVISEIMYHPVSGLSRDEDAALEFVELLNLSDQPVALFRRRDGRTIGWRLAGAIKFEFGEVTLPAHGRLVVTPEFSDAAAYQRFLAAYGLDSTAGDKLTGPFQGRLGNEGETLRLLEPGAPVAGRVFQPGAFAARAGGTLKTPWWRVDQVAYAPTAPWPVAADGSGLSLQRRAEAGYGNEPSNWVATAPTPLGALGSTVGDRDEDGLPDEWEWVHGLDLWSAEGINGADGDPDEDGLTNREEFQMGTDPQRLTVRFSRIWVSGRRVNLAFYALAGRPYRVEYRDRLTEGEWKILTNVDPQKENGEVRFWTPLSSDHPTRYYRLLTFE